MAAIFDLFSSNYDLDTLITKKKCLPDILEYGVINKNASEFGFTFRSKMNRQNIANKCQVIQHTPSAD